VIEAKPAGTTLVKVEHQSGRYVTGLPGWMNPPVYPLPFIYESTGTETRFTNGYDPEARSRRVFTFHRPETLSEWAWQISANPEAPTFRARLQIMPELDNPRLWEVQATAIRNIEASLREDRPRALIQMATGSGKTFTADTNLCYRLTVAFSTVPRRSSWRARDVNRESSAAFCGLLPGNGIRLRGGSTAAATWR
jgi:type I restriction enzyme R subunit